jgi:hypothetical protein
MKKAGLIVVLLLVSVAVISILNDEETETVESNVTLIEHEETNHFPAPVDTEIDFVETETNVTLTEPLVIKEEEEHHHDDHSHDHGLTHDHQHDEVVPEPYAYIPEGINLVEHPHDVSGHPRTADYDGPVDSGGYPIVVSSGETMRFDQEYVDSNMAILNDLKEGVNIDLPKENPDVARFDEASFNEYMDALNIMNMNGEIDINTFNRLVPIPKVKDLKGGDL